MRTDGDGELVSTIGNKCNYGMVAIGNVYRAARKMPTISHHLKISPIKLTLAISKLQVKSVELISQIIIKFDYFV
jgi:hypothetical protein